MRQLVQNLKDGKMYFLDVPVGQPGPGQVLVRVHYSAISAGTEGRTVKDARASYIGKARSRPAEVKKVIQLAKSQGLKSTYQLVMGKLEAPSPLGYSCAGEVIAVGSDVREFHIGDHVACGGAAANHAEVVSIGKNLCSLAAPEVDLAYASLATVAAIALQGIRQADLRLGEKCAAIGLGLIGQLTILLLRAAGVDAFGIDLDPHQVAATRQLGDCTTWQREEPGLVAALLQVTRGYGADAVIITAGTDSLDPVELAGEICRKKGKVVIVGAVPTGFSRANYYRKELDLRMSASYGPGRYDPIYEEKGIDYPIGYVRWTEQRNMQAFLDLMAAKKIDVAPLITHVFPFEQAAKAYQMIVEKKESFTGVLFKYDIEKPLESGLKRLSQVNESDSVLMQQKKATAGCKDRPGEIPLAGCEPIIGFIGAGNFAQNILLPAVQKAKIGVFLGLVESQPAAARSVADKYGFTFISADTEDLFSHTKINTVFIASRHGMHCSQVLQGLRANKNIFVEKPLCMNETELDEIISEYDKHPVRLMVGFNRRFAPLIKILRAALPANLPRAIAYRINASIVPADHWVHDPDIGGGRILGEACHFIDLTAHLAGASITSVAAEAMCSHPQLGDTVVIQLGFANGSIASISYFSNGNKAVVKEELEIFSGGVVAQLEDFQRLTILSAAGKKSYRSSGDKGHATQVHAFLQSIRDGQPAPIPFTESGHAMLATFKTMEAMMTGKKIVLKYS